MPVDLQMGLHELPGFLQTGTCPHATSVLFKNVPCWGGRCMTLVVSGIFSGASENALEQLVHDQINSSKPHASTRVQMLWRMLAMSWSKEWEQHLEDRFENTSDCILTARGLAQSSPRLLTEAAKHILRAICNRNLWLLVRSPPLSGKSVTVAALEELIPVVAPASTLLVVTCSENGKGYLRVAQMNKTTSRGITATALVEEIEEHLKNSKSDVILLMDDCSNWYSYVPFGQVLTRLMEQAPRLSLAGFAVARYFSAKLKAKGTWPEVWRESQCIGLDSLKVDFAREISCKRQKRFRDGLNQGLSKNGCVVVDSSVEGERRWKLALHHTAGHLGHLVMLLLESKGREDFAHYCLGDYPNIAKRSRGGCNWDNLAKKSREYLKDVALRYKAHEQWRAENCVDTEKELVCEGLLCYGDGGTVAWSCPLLRTATLCVVAADVPRAVNRCFAEDGPVTLRDAFNAVFASTTVADWEAIRDAQSLDKATWGREKLVAKYEAVYQLFLHSALAKISTRDQFVTPELPVHFHDAVVGRLDAWIDNDIRIGWEDLVGDHHTVKGPHKLEGHCNRWLDKEKYGLLKFNAAITCAYVARLPDKPVLEWATRWNEKHMKKKVAVLFIIAEDNFSCISIVVPFYCKDVIKINIRTGVAPMVTKIVPWAMESQFVGRQNTVDITRNRKSRGEKLPLPNPKRRRVGEGTATEIRIWMPTFMSPIFRTFLCVPECEAREYFQGCPKHNSGEAASRDTLFLRLSGICYFFGHFPSNYRRSWG